MSANQSSLWLRPAKRLRYDDYSKSPRYSLTPTPLPAAEGLFPLPAVGEGQGMRETRDCESATAD